MLYLLLVPNTYVDVLAASKKPLSPWSITLTFLSQPARRTHMPSKIANSKWPLPTMNTLLIYIYSMIIDVSLQQRPSRRPFALSHHRIPYPLAIYPIFKYLYRVSMYRSRPLYSASLPKSINEYL